jgi:acyl carrier protein
MRSLAPAGMARQAQAEGMQLVDNLKTPESVLQQTIEALQPFRKGDQPITPETDLTKDLNLDSLAVMDLMMSLEEKFDVSIPLNLVPELRTVADLAEKITGIMGET